MKKSELKYIIKEALEATTMEMVEPIDEIGTFMIVKKPKRGMAMEDMMQEVSIYDSIMKELLERMRSSLPKYNLKQPSSGKIISTS